MGNDRCLITGWGATEFGGWNANVLQEAVVPIVSRDQCNEWISENPEAQQLVHNEHYTQLCAGYEEGGIDTCQGDSGGPLACKYDGVWVLDGIVSFGWQCARKRSPGVYTRVADDVILDWIKTKMDGPLSNTGTSTTSTTTKTTTNTTTTTSTTPTTTTEATTTSTTTTSTTTTTTTTTITTTSTQSSTEYATHTDSEYYDDHYPGYPDHSDDHPEFVVKHPYSQNAYNYKVVFNDANNYERFYIDASAFNSEAHIGISRFPKHKTQKYEIVLGGWGGYRSVIRRGNQGKTLAITKHGVNAWYTFKSDI